MNWKETSEVVEVVKVGKDEKASLLPERCTAAA